MRINQTDPFLADRLNPRMIRYTHKHSAVDICINAARLYNIKVLGAEERSLGVQVLVSVGGFVGKAVHSAR